MIDLLLAIDPSTTKCGVAEWSGDLSNLKLLDVRMVKTEAIITRPNDVLLVEDDALDRILVIERPYVGTRTYLKDGKLKTAALSQSTVTLAQTVGQISGILRVNLGFKVVEAPAWGHKDTWIVDMLGAGITSDQVKAMSIMRATADYPELRNMRKKLTHDMAAAVCMGKRWINNEAYKQKVEAALGGKG